MMLWLGGVGSQIPGCMESQRTAQAKKEALCAKRPPNRTVLVAVNTQPEGLASPLLAHISVCKGGLQPGVVGGGDSLGPAPSGREGADA